MKDDQKDIYYASGESVEKIDTLPQVEQVKETHNYAEFINKNLNLTFCISQFK